VIGDLLSPGLPVSDLASVPVSCQRVTPVPKKYLSDEHVLNFKQENTTPRDDF